MESGDSDNGHNNVSNHAADQTAPTRRTSSRIARLNRFSSHSAHSRPYPPPSFQNSATWMAQHRQMERQRSYYSDYYLSNRNRNAQANANQNSQGQQQQAVALQSETPAQIASPASTQTAARTAAPHILERVTNEMIRINNAATQTNNTIPNINNSTSSVASPPSDASSHPATSPSLLLTPLHEYIRTIDAFITYGRIGNGGSIVLNGGNESNANSRASVDIIRFAPLNVHPDTPIEPINFGTLFGIPDNLFNDGLSKNEINRHTIQYEYKPTLPAKRKRTKTEESDTQSTSPSAATACDNCSICLDKLNPNVQVRRLPCLHVFHIKCIDKWLKRNKKCPICRISITINYDTLMSSLESGSSIDQCISQQESSTVRQQFGPTITLSLSSRGNSEFTFSGSLLHATVELTHNTSSTPSASDSSTAGPQIQ